MPQCCYLELHSCVPEIAAMRLAVAILSVSVLGFVLAPSVNAEVGMKKTDKDVEVTLDGQPFATYIFNAGFKPIIWPIIGPTGKEMTRAWPLRNGRGRTKETGSRASKVVLVRSWQRQWHRFLGRDREAAREAGADGAGQGRRRQGRHDRHQERLARPRRQALAQRRAHVRFGGDKDSRQIDFDVTVTAVADQVTFGDTKEGSFGLRDRRVDAGRTKTGGKIITSEGLEDDKAWGKPAAWVDYHGPVQGETLGIAILNHPSSFRYPTHWHVRTYGLFAANPWGLHDFTNGKEHSDYTMKKGDSFTLRYRVIFHKGTEKDGKIAEAFANYTKE